jgi:ribosomal protein S12 methylthiotransferase
MPIQHINDDILKAMKRKTSKADIISTIIKLRREIPDMVIRTSLMVGFPGESEANFEELKTFIQQYPLDNIGIFKYSKEKGSSSYDMENHVDEDIKEKRFQDLMKKQEEIVKKRSKLWIGKKIEVMLESYHPETNLLMVGRYYGQCPEIDGVVILNDHRKAKAFGRLHLVEITDVAGYDLIGTILDNPQNIKPPRPLKLAKI